jgi:hypothetical protein
MDNLGSTQIEELLTALGAHLAEGGNSAGIVVVGGSSLAVMGWLERTTQDIDVIAQAKREGGAWVLAAPDPLPAHLVAAVALVARDFGLPGDWLNTTIGAQWSRGLPPGFLEEIEWRQYGTLHVGFAGRRGLISLKLFAAVDQGPRSVHFQDLLALSPTDSELEQAAEWVLAQDAAEGFPVLVEEVVAHVRDASGRTRPSR